MPPNFELLTVPTTLADYKLNGLSVTVRSAHSLHSSPAKEENLDVMAQQQSRSTSQNQPKDDTELWFSLPSHRRRQEEQSAYQATSNRLSVNSGSATSSRTHMAVPTISTTPDLNKPLPPVSAESDKDSRKATSLRSFFRGRGATHLDPSHLQPVPYTYHQRHSSADSGLTLDVSGLSQIQHSRSMPSSPAYDQAHSDPTRIRSAVSDCAEASYYQPYSVPTTNPQTNMSASSQASDNLEIPPTRVRSFPETSLSPTARQNVSNRPRPHTWLSPTEPFSDPSQFHLFVEATTGLPDDTDLWSPNGPNRLQGSLFARRGTLESIAASQQYIPAPIPDRTHQTASWQSFEPPLSTSRSVSAPTSSLPYANPQPQLHMTPHMNAINAELEMLGLDSDVSPDEELPDYEQSQAEMNARKREEAAARARELEARWRGARRARGRS